MQTLSLKVTVQLGSREVIKVVEAPIIARKGNEFLLVKGMTFYRAFKGVQIHLDESRDFKSKEEIPSIVEDLGFGKPDLTTVKNILRLIADVEFPTDKAGVTWFV
jgi:hypothetical protein